MDAVQRMTPLLAFTRISLPSCSATTPITVPSASWTSFLTSVFICISAPLAAATAHTACT